MPLSEGQAGLRLRLFEEPIDSRQDYEQDYAQARSTDSTVSLIRLKEMATELLPGTSNLRALILSEPDFLPREQAVVKVEVFSRLLYKEQARP